ncbi:ABC transporter ATP-binding protein [Paracoccaceae bacterium GXU_MW_L88]
MTSSDWRLDVRNLTRHIAGQSAVEDVSFRLAAGQVTCLLGPSGCGKSTTLRMIAGVERPDSGQVFADGVALVDGKSIVPPERRGVGLLFQDFALFPHKTIAQNVAFGLPRRSKETPARVAEVLARVNMSGYEARFPHELSGGEQQRIALARALAPRPRIMLLDEPFSGLDQRLREDIRSETLSILREEGTSVVMVTHEPEEAMDVADTIALMRAGRIVQEGSPDELYNAPVDKEAAAFFSDINVLEGQVVDGRVETKLGAFDARGLAEGAHAEVVIRPHHLNVAPNGADRGVAAEIRHMRFLGNETFVSMMIGGTSLRARNRDLRPMEPGGKVTLLPPKDAYFVFERAKR